MGGRLRDFLQLIRLPNIFTAIADVVAGYLIVRGSDIRPAELLALAACSSAVYAGGCALNDLRDRDLDGRERPFRPIPSGRVTAGEALTLTCALFAGALLAAWAAGGESFFVASVLVACVVAYDLHYKDSEKLGPVSMGLCRALNLLLGMSANPSFTPAVVVFPMLSFTYVFSLTTLSRFEVSAGVGQKAVVIAVSWGLVMAVLGLLTASSILSAGSVLYYLVLAIWTGSAAFEALLTPSPEAIGSGVKAMILAIPLLDATYCSGIHGFAFGIPVVLASLPALWISRRLYVT